MRVALYHPWVYLRSGVERMIYELVDRSRHDWVIFTHRYEPASTYPEISRLEVIELVPSVSVQRSLGPLSNAAGTILRTRLPDVGARALLVSSEGMGDLILWRNRLPALAYCHTPLKILHDPVTRARLATMSRGKHIGSTVLGPGFSAVDRFLWRRYRHVFVNSHEVKGRVERARLRPSGPVEVLHPGVDLRRFGTSTPVRQRRFLVAGRIMWQKQIELAIDAFADAHRRGLDAELIVAGTVDVKSEPYYAALQRRAAGLPIRFEPDPPDERLVELLGTAVALVLPAPNEDFGMIALEAMAAGTPVLAVDAGGPRESVLDGRTGWLLPRDPDAFADQMLTIAADPSSIDPLREAARRRAGEFSWDRFTARLDQVVDEVGAASTTASEPRQGI